jgi:hypothetical protein
MKVNERKLRGYAGFSLVAEHLVLLFYIALLTVKDRFTTDEMFTSFGLIGPLFAAYVTASIRRLLQQDAKERSPQVAPERAVLVIGIPAIFFVLIVLGVTWKGFSSLTFDAFVKLVGVCETFVGIYAGMVVEHLFGSTKPGADTATETEGEKGGTA